MAAESWKKQTYWSLPVYTGDVSGVCSALYELGGMVVMHDPSGCNSTYNTHDEIRWISRESLIFISGLTQLDAICGNDRKLIDDIVQAAEQFHPEFIAIANSPVPWLIGTDFSAICSKISSVTGIPAFRVETNAMHDYTYGAGHAFLELARELFSEEDAAAHNDSGASEEEDSWKSHTETYHGTDKAHADVRRRLRLNVLGMTPLDFTAPDESARLRRLLESAGFEVVSMWAMDDTLDNLRNALRADVNLAVSSSGIYTARWMEEAFGIPYTAGVPIGAFADVLFSSLVKCASDRVSRTAYLDLPGAAERNDSVRGCIAGECVISGSRAADRMLSGRGSWDIVPLTETAGGLIKAGTPCPKGESEIREVLGRYDEVCADPMLKPACSKDCRFEETPHFALSGRLYLDRMGSIIG